MRATLVGAPAPEAMARALRRRRGFFFLDSARPEEITGRAYSIIGFDPFLTWTVHGDEIVVESAEGREVATGDPWDHLRQLMSRYGKGGAGCCVFDKPTPDKPQPALAAADTSTAPRKRFVDSAETPGCRPEREAGTPVAGVGQAGSGRDLRRPAASASNSGSDPTHLPFAGGAFGYFGYEFAARAAGVASRRPPTESNLPDAQLGFYDGVIVCDLSAGTTYAVANPVGPRSAEKIIEDLREAVAAAADGRNARSVPLHKHSSRLDRKAMPTLGESHPVQPHPMDRVAERSERFVPSVTTPALPTSNLTHADYLARVARAQAYLAAGDIYQVNFAQRFEVATAEDPFVIYERLRRLNPAAFSAYLDLPGFQILSSSPELMVRLDASGRLLTRPIKGTRPRGETAAEDQRLAAELLASAKDQAELLMIVDLLRNDLGRVCRYGSVQVDERARLEAHPTVFHAVATISGRLAEDCDLFDALRSLLPGGSITGAPKIRAMQIIDELEPSRRDVYTGSIGFLGFDGTCELNIAIRTIVCRGGRASYQVGGGIVADSNPESEYHETLAKGRALRAALLGQARA